MSKFDFKVQLRGQARKCEAPAGPYPFKLAFARKSKAPDEPSGCPSGGIVTSCLDHAHHSHRSRSKGEFRRQYTETEMFAAKLPDPDGNRAPFRSRLRGFGNHDTRSTASRWVSFRLVVRLPPDGHPLGSSWASPVRHVVDRTPTASLERFCFFRSRKMAISPEIHAARWLCVTATRCRKGWAGRLHHNHRTHNLELEGPRAPHSHGFS